MSSYSQCAANSEVQFVLKNIETETRRDELNERRSVHRTPFARPVTVQVRKTDESFLAFSQNISGAGIALISQSEFQEGVKAILQIHSLDNAAHFILSECRWCRGYGKGWFCSGWNFQNVVGRQ